MVSGQNLNDKNVLIDVDYYRGLVQSHINLVSEEDFKILATKPKWSCVLCGTFRSIGICFT